MSSQDYSLRYSVRVLKARENLEKNQEELLEVHFEEIKRYCKNLSFFQRGTLFQGLEAFVQKMLAGTIGELLDLETSIGFNPAIAKSIRKELGLYQTQLAQKLGADPQRGQRKITHYERQGIKRMGKDPFKLRYLEWLKEQGYNPFNI
jgi:hypothetical protein